MNDWLSANNITLNAEKTELVTLKSLMEVLSDVTKTKFSEERLYPSNSVKYLGARIHRFLHWHELVNNIVVKLNSAKLLLHEARNYVNMKILRNIYLLIFDSHLRCSYIVWAQNIT